MLFEATLQDALDFAAQRMLERGNTGRDNDSCRGTELEQDSENHGKS